MAVRSARSLQFVSQPTTQYVSYQPRYNPATGQQFQPGTRQNLVDIIAPGGNPANALKAGWAPQIGHITTSAATTKRRRTNPLLAAPLESTKRKNPFVVPENISSDLFGLNIPT